MDPPPPAMSAPPLKTPHRLSAVSASQALGAPAPPAHISTSSDALDTALGHGLPRGKVSELCGPPGSGKTALALQIAANTLQAAAAVVWVDTSHPFPPSRLISMISAQSPPSSDPLTHLTHLQILHTPSLAHLLALFLHALPSFPPAQAALIVIDNISTPFSQSFLPGHEDPARKLATMSTLIKALSALALRRNIAVLLTNQMTTRVSAHSGAVLIPAVGSPVWTNALAARMLVHRNDVHSGEDRAQVRFVTVLKSQKGGKQVRVKVRITEEGIRDVDMELKGVSSSAPEEVGRRSRMTPPPGMMSSSAPVSVVVQAEMLGSNSPVASSDSKSPVPSPVPSPSLSAPAPAPAPAPHKRKRGLEAGEIAASDDEEDSSGDEWGAGVENILDDDGLGAEMMTPPDSKGAGEFGKVIARASDAL